MMDVIRNASFDSTLMKEPRGFLRVIQFLLSILAFATVCSSVTVIVNVTCLDTKSTKTVPVTYSYPFNMKNYPVDAPFCPFKNQSTTTMYPFKDLVSYASSAQFFCFIGVMSFLLCIAYCIGYVFFRQVFMNGSKGAMADFIFSAIWTLFWFIASTAWASNLSVMSAYLSPSNIIKTEFVGDKYCGAKGLSCSPGSSGNNATLIVSVLFGYLNMLVWGAGLWFLYKETHWHKEPQQDTQTFDQPAATGGDGSYQAPDNTDSNIY